VSPWVQPAMIETVPHGLRAWHNSHAVLTSLRMQLRRPLCDSIDLRAHTEHDLDGVTRDRQCDRNQRRVSDLHACLTKQAQWRGSPA